MARETMLDVDGNGMADALTDGIMMMRYLFGFRGNAVIDEALGPDATRTTAAATCNPSISGSNRQAISNKLTITRKMPETLFLREAGFLISHKLFFAIGGQSGFGGCYSWEDTRSPE